MNSKEPEQANQIIDKETDFLYDIFNENCLSRKSVRNSVEVIYSRIAAALTVSEVGKEEASANFYQVCTCSHPIVKDTCPIHGQPPQSTITTGRYYFWDSSGFDPGEDISIIATKLLKRNKWACLRASRDTLFIFPNPSK